MSRRTTIALLIGGRIVAFDKVAASWRAHLLDANPNCDFFIYASLNSNPNTETIIQRSRELLGPSVTVNYRTEDYVPPGEDAKLAYNVRSMYWHNMNAFEMCMSGDNCVPDIIVKWRADIELLRPFVLPSTIQSPSQCPQTLYIPLGSDWGGLNDQIAIGAPSVMSFYCDLYKHIDELWPVRHPERLLKRYITDNPAIIIERTRIHYKLHPDRFVS